MGCFKTRQFLQTIMDFFLSNIKTSLTSRSIPTIFDAWKNLAIFVHKKTFRHFSVSSAFAAESSQSKILPSWLFASKGLLVPQTALQAISFVLLLTWPGTAKKIGLCEENEPSNNSFRSLLYWRMEHTQARYLQIVSSLLGGEITTAPREFLRIITKMKDLHEPPKFLAKTGELWCFYPLGTCGKLREILFKKHMTIFGGVYNHGTWYHDSLSKNWAHVVNEMVIGPW